MKALVYTQPGELQLQERPMPELLPGEVVLKIEAVGICGSDMHAWHGHDPRRQPGLVLGHEFVGRVVEAAPGGRHAVGDVVASGAGVWCSICSPGVR